MRNRIVAGALAVLLAAPSHAAAESTAHAILATEAKLSTRLKDAIALAEGEDVAAADAALTAIISHTDFKEMPREARLAALSNAGWMAIRSNDLQRARNLYQTSSDIDPDDPDTWYRLSLIELDLDNPEQAATHLLHLLSRWPHTLENLSQQHISMLEHELEHHSPLRLVLLQRLFELEWSREGLGASHLWHELAVLLVERGDTGAAKAAIDHIRTPQEVIKMRVDRRFDAFVDRDAQRFDVQSVAAARAGELRVKAMLEPERLDVLMELTYALLALGRVDEVLAMSDAALALIEALGPGQTLFEDVGDRVWLMNNRAIALRRMGRIDEALEQMLVASELEEEGQPNVSQALNLGGFYCGLGRPDDALEAIAPVGMMSGYGRMVQMAVKHCAARRKGDIEAGDEALAYLRDHRRDAHAIFVDALLEADRMDEAAAVVIGLLEDADTRADALFEAQEFLRPDALPDDAIRFGRQADLYRRPDVRDAVVRVGRIEQHPIHADNSLG